MARLKETEHFDVKVDVVGKNTMSLCIICASFQVAMNTFFVKLDQTCHHVVLCSQTVFSSFIFGREEEGSGTTSLEFLCWLSTAPQ